MRLRRPITLMPSTGRGTSYRNAVKVIRLQQHGCVNRSFFHIVVMERDRYHLRPPIEMVGSFDPMANMYGEHLASFNFERIKHWLSIGALVSDPVAQLLGLAGYLPIHPRTYITAWRNRKEYAEKMTKKETSEDNA